jgi:hypothetical protein
MVGWLLGYLVDPASHSSGKRLFSGFHFGFSRADGMAGGGWLLVFGLGNPQTGLIDGWVDGLK